MGSMWAEPVTATAGPLAVTSLHTSLFPSHMSQLVTNLCPGACPWVHPPLILGHPWPPSPHCRDRPVTGRASWGAQEQAQLPSYFIKLELYLGALFNSGVCTTYASMLRGESWAFHRSPQHKHSDELHKFYFLSTGRMQGERSSANPGQGEGLLLPLLHPDPFRGVTAAAGPCLTHPGGSWGSRGGAQLQPGCVTNPGQ